MFLLYFPDGEVLFTVIERSTDCPWRHHSGRNAPVVRRSSLEGITGAQRRSGISHAESGGGAIDCSSA
jgi:hypothetical protein